MNTVQLANGLSIAQEDQLDQLIMDIIRLQDRVEAFPKHRSLSLAITKLDEARHWLRDRMGRKA